MTSLNDFKNICKTDKYDDYGFSGPGTGHNYVNSFYESICQPIKETATAVLELGVHLGHSHLLWSCFFPNANIYGIDYKNPPYPDHNRIKIYGNTDCYTSEAIAELEKCEPNGFDLIIDDGDHIPKSQFYVITNYFKLLKPGGHLVIEDIIGNDVLDYMYKTGSFFGEPNIFHSPITISNQLMGALVLKKSG